MILRLLAIIEMGFNVEWLLFSFAFFEFSLTEFIFSFVLYLSTFCVCLLLWRWFFRLFKLNSRLRFWNFYIFIITKDVVICLKITFWWFIVYSLFKYTQTNTNTNKNSIHSIIHIHLLWKVYLPAIEWNGRLLFFFPFSVFNGKSIVGIVVEAI